MMFDNQVKRSCFSPAEILLTISKFFLRFLDKSRQIWHRKTRAEGGRLYNYTERLLLDKRV